MGDLTVNRSLWKKLARDLAASRGRAVLAVLAIATCLTVFGAVLIAAPIVGREFDRSYRDTRPPAATLVLHDGLTPAQAEPLRRRVAGVPGVRAAALRTQLTTRIMIDGQWSENPLQIFVVLPDDPGQVGRVGIDQGSWPPPPDGIMIERDALALLGLRVGDDIVVTASTGSPVSLRVVGITHDPSLANARQEQQGYAYASPAVLGRLGQPELLDQLKITTSSADPDTITGIARTVATQAQTLGQAVDEIQVPEPGRHPHRSWVDLITVILLVFGGTSVLLSALLVATMISRMVAVQVPQIGAMKAIGGRTGPILQLYVTMSLTVSMIATTLALVPAVLLGRRLAELLLQMYDMDAVDLTAPWWCFTVVAAVGVLLAPLLALVPTLAACRTTVRAALDHEGGRRPLPRRAGSLSGRMQTILGRIPLAPATALGVRNSVRRPGRFLLLVGQLALAGGLFVGGAGTLTGLYAFEASAAAQQRWDVEVHLSRPEQDGPATQAVAALPGVTAVETWTVLPFSEATTTRSIPVTDTYPDQGHGARLIAAVPAETQMLQAPLLAGRWLREGDQRAVVLDQRFAAGRPGDPALGDRITLAVDGHATTWHVIGVVGQKFGGPQAFVTPDGFAAALGRSATANRIEIGSSAHDPKSQAALADSAAHALQSVGFAVQTAMPIGRLAAAIDGHVYAAGYTLLVVAALIGLAGCVSAGATTSNGVLERVREFGIMQAIGAPPGAIRRIVLVEGLGATVCGIALSFGLALGVTAALGSMIGTMIGGESLPLRFAAGAAGAWTVATLLLTTLAALPPARYAARLTARDALAYL